MGTKHARLSRDVELTFRDIHVVRAKAGTRLIATKGGGGVIYYAIPESLVETDSDRGPRSIWAHDARHYFIWAPSHAVTVDDDATRAAIDKAAGGEA